MIFLIEIPIIRQSSSESPNIRELSWYVELKNRNAKLWHLYINGFEGFSRTYGITMDVPPTQQQLEVNFLLFCAGIFFTKISIL